MMLIFGTSFIDRYFTMNNFSSSFLSLDGMRFILEESSDDTPILNHVVDNEIDINTLELVLKFRQTRQEKRTSSSSRKSQKMQCFIRREREEAHECLYKDYFVKYSIYKKTHFSMDFEYKNACSFTLLKRSRLVLSSSS